MLLNVFVLHHEFSAMLSAWLSKAQKRCTQDSRVGREKKMIRDYD